MQVRCEFHSLVELDDVVASLKQQWPEWSEKILGLARMESSSWPASYACSLMWWMMLRTETASSFNQLYECMHTNKFFHNFIDHYDAWIEVSFDETILYLRGLSKDGYFIHHFEVKYWLSDESEQVYHSLCVCICSGGMFAAPGGSLFSGPHAILIYEAWYCLVASFSMTHRRSSIILKQMQFMILSTCKTWTLFTLFIVLYNAMRG